jgi:hypothetical protein
MAAAAFDGASLGWYDSKTSTWRPDGVDKIVIDEGACLHCSFLLAEKGWAQSAANVLVAVCACSSQPFQRLTAAREGHHPV